MKSIRQSFNMHRYFAKKENGYWSYYKITALGLSPLDAVGDVFGDNAQRDIQRLIKEVDMGTTIFREADKPITVNLSYLCELMSKGELILE